MAREHGGLGLGLAIVKELTEMHGGSVAVASGGLGRGAEFRVRLPALMGVDAAVDATSDEHRIEAAALAGVHVLAVDDNDDALDVLAIALTSAGAAVRTVSTGAEAVREWEHGATDVIVCDLAMPEIDGFEVLRRIREREGALTRRTPAVALSAHATLEHRQRSLKAGFAAHVVKPYRTADLIDAIETALAQHT
jgi:CheY-like chemotaxis protein